VRKERTVSMARPGRELAHPLEAVGRAVEEGGVRKLLIENGLSIVMGGLFILFLIAQSVAGWLYHNEEAREHGHALLAYLPYLMSGHFWGATLENWESEFLQMAAYVALTACLYQKGSAESRKLPAEGENPQDQDPSQERDQPDAPGPVKAGGWRLWIYERSLASSLMFLFLLSFWGHAVAGSREYSQEQMAHGHAAVGIWQFMGTATFWFQSFQNWQSEFLAVLAIVVLSIWLRGKGSPESKPVAAPHTETGTG
jgi:hypothetical protein